jgi:hypothetical protein
VNLIREIEGYVWDSKEAEKGYDEPLKKDDHAVDALRYAVKTHKIPTLTHPDDIWKQQMEKGHFINKMSNPRAYGFR